MSNYWELNGVKLRSSTGESTTIVTALQYRGGTNQSLTDIHGGTQDRQRLNNELYTHEFTFAFIGQGENKYKELDDALQVLETDNVWTLQAPTTLDIHVYGEKKRAAFSTQNLSINVVNKAKVELKVQAVMNGLWIADDGDYCEKITGSFELTSTGPSVYTLSDGVGLEDQDGDATGTTPLITLPEQTVGYPTAVRASDFAVVTLTPDSTSTTTIDGNTVTVEVYDLTGYLHPAPSVAGDVGLFEVCSSPTDNYLSGGEGFLSPMSTLDTFGFNDLTANAAGVFAVASTLDTFGFSDLTASSNADFAGASTLPTFALSDLTANATLLAPLLTESGDMFTTEAGDNLIIE